MQPGDGSRMIRCSVVVPTRERPALLGGVLSALVAQDLPPDEYEVIVSDEVGSAATRAQVSRWAASHPVRIRYVGGSSGQRGRAAARNAGWRAAEGKIVAFIDENTMPQSDWLRHGLAALEDGADAASGRIVVPGSDGPTTYDRVTERLETSGIFTANGFCWRWALACVGGFDSRFRTAWAEDNDLRLKLIKNGFEVLVASDAVVVRPIRRRSRGLRFRPSALLPFLSARWRGVRTWATLRIALLMRATGVRG